MIDFLGNNWVSIAGAIIGLLYLFLEYKANVWMWLVGVGMCLFYIYIFYSTHLYASMGIYVYFLLASVYGFIMWVTKYKKKSEEDQNISHIVGKYIWFIIVAIILLAFVLYFILIRFGTYLPYVTVGDAITTSLNFIALWMVSRKWVEQWLLVIPANGLSSVLLFFQNDMISGTMFLIYFIVSILGYFKWKKMAKVPTQ